MQRLSLNDRDVVADRPRNHAGLDSKRILSGGDYARKHPDEQQEKPKLTGKSSVQGKIKG